MAGYSLSKAGVNALVSRPSTPCSLGRGKKDVVPTTSAGTTLDRVIQSQKTMPSGANLDQWTNGALRRKK
jgi:hypothetical protein